VPPQDSYSVVPGSSHAHLDPAVIAAGQEEHGVGVAEVNAPDALLMCLVLGHWLASVHIPERDNACARPANMVNSCRTE